MYVMDVFSAGGYYAELLARAVGAKGQVIAYNNPPYAKFAETGIAARYDGKRCQTSGRSRAASRT